MGLQPAHSLESFKRRRPRESGDPRPMDSRFRGNDVTFERSEARNLALKTKEIPRRLRLVGITG
jgi:hypothetical protein